MEIKEAEKIIDDMYQDRMNTRIEKIEKGTVIHAEKEVTFTKLEEASVLLLREELSLKRKIEEQEKVIELMSKEIEINTSDDGVNLRPATLKEKIDYFKKKANENNGK